MKNVIILRPPDSTQGEAVTEPRKRLQPLLIQFRAQTNLFGVNVLLIAAAYRTGSSSRKWIP